MKPKSHPSFFPSPTPSPCPPPNKRKICLTSLANWHSCNYIQILSHTKATHITKKKNTNISSQLFSTRKKEYKTYTFLRSIFFFNLLETSSPTFKGNSIVVFFCLFFVGFLFFFCTFFFFLTSKHLCRHHKLWR